MILENSTLTAERDLLADKITFLSRFDYLGKKGVLALEKSLSEFQSTYDRLTLDQFMNDGGTYRLRRFGRFRLWQNSLQIEKLENKPFFQSKEKNPLNGGTPRFFDEMEPSALHNPILHQIIRKQFELLPNLEKLARPRSWLVYVHQIRIVGKPGVPGNPSPEGKHQDGHYYVGQVLIQRKNVDGATSLAFDLDGNLIFEGTLKNQLESILINDRETYHNVTPIQSEDQLNDAVRDMLLIDFNPEYFYA